MCRKSKNDCLQSFETSILDDGDFFERSNEFGPNHHLVNIQKLIFTDVFINKTISYWFYFIWTVQCIFIWAQSSFCALSVITRNLVRQVLKTNNREDFA
jgi:hypothetical protein